MSKVSVDARMQQLLTTLRDVVRQVPPFQGPIPWVWTTWVQGQLESKGVSDSLIPALLNVARAAGYRFTSPPGVPAGMECTTGPGGWSCGSPSTETPISKYDQEKAINYHPPSYDFRWHAPTNFNTDGTYKAMRLLQQSIELEQIEEDVL